MRLNKASFTVEISLLIPFIMGALVFICMAAVWLYDNHTTYVNSVKVILYAKQTIDSGEELTANDIDIYAEEVKDSAMLGKVELSIDTERSLVFLNISNSGKVELPLSYWMEGLDWPVFSKLGAKVSCITVRPVSQIREYKLAKGIIE